MNLDNWKLVLDKIKDDPSCWKQNEWHCGTKHCFAGWAQILGGNKVTENNSRAVRRDARMFLEISRTDAHVLAKTLRIIRDSFGDSGFESIVIDGIGHLCQRYNGVIKEEEVVDKLGALHGGVNGLLGKAEVLHKQTGNSKSLCIAAATVDILNKKRGKQRIASWWK